MIIEQSFYAVVVATCNRTRTTMIAVNHRRRAQLSTWPEYNYARCTDIFRSTRAHMHYAAAATCNVWCSTSVLCSTSEIYCSGSQAILWLYCGTVTCVKTIRRISNLTVAGPHTVLDWDGKFLERIVRVMFNQWKVEIIQSVLRVSGRCLY